MSYGLTYTPYNTNLFLNNSNGTPFDPDAQAFITAANITDSIQQNAINQFVIDLKIDNLWDKMKAIYPFVGGTAFSHKWNLKDPRNLNIAFRLIFNGGMTHSATGVLFNGTNGWADTSAITSTLAFGVYTRKITDNNADYIGSQSHVLVPNPPDPDDEFYISGYHVNYAAYEISDLYNVQNTTNTIRTGLSSVCADGNQKYYKNGILKASNPISASSYGTLYYPGFNLAIGATNPNSEGLPIYGYSNQEVAFGFIADNILTNLDNFNLYNRVQHLQAELSREV